MQYLHVVYLMAAEMRSLIETERRPYEHRVEAEI